MGFKDFTGGGKDFVSGGGFFILNLRKIQDNIPVIDGVIVELKTVSGNRATLGKSFRRGYKQGRSLLKKHGLTGEHSVFLRLFSPLTVDSVRAKIAGELKNSIDKGCCICFFEASKELYFWTYDELRAIVGKK
jgi:hypothetical protein